MPAVSRRMFAMGGAAAIAGPALAASGARAVEPLFGKAALPAEPKRVVAIDSRISLEMALALNLPLVGYSHSRARPWVPVPAQVPFLAAPPDLEQILMLEPDLILCPNTASHSDWWPLAKLTRIAPVLESDHRISWQSNLEHLSGRLGQLRQAAKIIAEHGRAVAAIRDHHGRAIETSLVAAANYDALKRRLVIRSAGTGNGLVMPAQVLADLGGREVAASQLGPYGEVALESFGDVLGPVDAILLLDFGDGAPRALQCEALWQRLPAVRAGRVQLLAGNCVFGSSYTARYLASAWQALFERLSS